MTESVPTCPDTRIQSQLRLTVQNASYPPPVLQHSTLVLLQPIGMEEDAFHLQSLASSMVQSLSLGKLLTAAALRYGPATEKGIPGQSPPRHYPSNWNLPTQATTIPYYFYILMLHVNLLITFTHLYFVALFAYTEKVQLNSSSLSDQTRLCRISDLVYWSKFHEIWYMNVIKDVFYPILSHYK